MSVDIDLLARLRRGNQAEQAAADEIEVLRHILRTLAPKIEHPKNWAWMEGSPADLAYERALGNGSSRDV